MLTQKEIFEKALEQNREMLGSVSDGIKEEEKEYLIAVARCYNKTIELIKYLNMTEQQSKIFIDKSKENLYTEGQLSQIAYSICCMYKSEYNIKENAEEILNKICDPEKSELRMSQIYIAAVKNLTLEEIDDILTAPDEDIVEKTKQVFCKHYNKEYLGKQNVIESQEIDDDFR